MLWHLNAHIERPDLTVILVADPDLCRRRAEARGRYSRFHGTDAEGPDRYRAVAGQLTVEGHNVIVHDVASSTAEEAAAALFEAIAKLQAEVRETTSS